LTFIIFSTLINNSMKRVCMMLAVGALLAGCAKQQAATVTALGDTRTKEVQFLDDDTYWLTEASQDKSYGYDRRNPVKVGGVTVGPKNEKRFLNALLGPNGEPITYFRAGNCCAFETPNGLFNNTGLLDRYRVTWAGASDTLDIYINMYDAGDLMIPVGLTAKKKP
jgi:hypothetical protein